VSGVGKPSTFFENITDNDISETNFYSDTETAHLDRKWSSTIDRLKLQQEELVTLVKKHESFIQEQDKQIQEIRNQLKADQLDRKRVMGLEPEDTSRSAPVEVKRIKISESTEVSIAGKPPSVEDIISPEQEQLSVVELPPIQQSNLKPENVVKLEKIPIPKKRKRERKDISLSKKSDKPATPNAKSETKLDASHKKSGYLTKVEESEEFKIEDAIKIKKGTSPTVDNGFSSDYNIDEMKRFKMPEPKKRKRSKPSLRSRKRQAKVDKRKPIFIVKHMKKKNYSSDQGEVEDSKIANPQPKQKQKNCLNMLSEEDLEEKLTSGKIIGLKNDHNTISNDDLKERLSTYKVKSSFFKKDKEKSVKKLPLRRKSATNNISDKENMPTLGPGITFRRKSSSMHSAVK